MIKTVSFIAEQNLDVNLLIFGAVHGNEKCGTQAIKRVIAEIENGDIRLVKGSVTFVPICNPRAYHLDVRYVQRNLNRFLVPMANPDSYEAEIGNILCPLLERCDVLLDLHSYSVGGPAFAFVGQGDVKGQKFAANLGNQVQMTGWTAAYTASPRKIPAATQSVDESTGTTEYARRFGATSVTLECGQHLDPQSPEIAYQAIRSALRYLEMTNEPPVEKKSAADAELVTVKRVYFRESEGTLAKSWKHMDKVVKDEILARNIDGTTINAPDNGYIILPDVDCALNTEWFYFGISNRETPTPR